MGKSAGKCSLWLVLVLLLSACSVPQTEPVMRLDQSVGGAMAAALSFEHETAIISNVDNGIVVWDLHTQTERFRWMHEGNAKNIVTHVKISDDGLYAMTSDREAFALWDMTVGEPVGFWRVPDASVRDIALSKKGHVLVVGKGNGEIMVLIPKSGRRLDFMGHSEKINSLALSPNGFYVLSGGNDYQALLWDTRSAQVIHRFAHESRVSYVGLDPQGRFALTADSKGGAFIWDIKTGQQLSQLAIDKRQQIFTALSFSEDGEYLLTGSPSRMMDLWEVSTGQLLGQVKVGVNPDSAMPTAVVYAVDFVSTDLDRVSVMSISSSGYTERWDILTQR
jgi:WD40 repeat protein